MKKIYTPKLNTSLVPQSRSFRRFVKKMFRSFLKRQIGGGENGFQKEVIQRLKEIEGMIARKAMRQTKRDK